MIKTEQKIKIIAKIAKYNKLVVACALREYIKPDETVSGLVL